MVAFKTLRSSHVVQSKFVLILHDLWTILFFCLLLKIFKLNTDKSFDMPNTYFDWSMKLSIEIQSVDTFMNALIQNLNTFKLSLYFFKLFEEIKSSPSDFTMVWLQVMLIWTHFFLFVLGFPSPFTYAYTFPEKRKKCNIVILERGIKCNHI